MLDRRVSRHYRSCADLCVVETPTHFRHAWGVSGEGRVPGLRRTGWAGEEQQKSAFADSGHGKTARPTGKEPPKPARGWVGENLSGERV
jgi:hypothetical protein